MLSLDHALPSQMDMAFPQRLAAIRREKGLTQQQLSDMTGINVAQIRRYETGKSQPTLEVIRRLVMGLGATADYLLFDPEERGPATDDLRHQLEAANHLDEDERKILKALIEGIVMRHEVKRMAASA